MILAGDFMHTFQELLLKYKDYSNPKTKIAREVKNGTYIKVYKNFYIDDPNYSKFAIGCELISSTSYISFFSALSYYNLILDVTFSFTLATTKLNKHKTIKTAFGNFIYRDVPIDVFIEEVVYQKENGNSFMIATKEKALCDTLYSYYPAVKSMKQIEILLDEDLRFDMREFYKLNPDKILKLCTLYKSTTLKNLAKFIERDKNNGKFNY